MHKDITPQCVAQYLAEELQANTQEIENKVSEISIINGFINFKLSEECKSCLEERDVNETEVKSAETQIEHSLEVSFIRAQFTNEAFELYKKYQVVVVIFFGGGGY